MSLATTCPQCKTSFKVVPDQLKLRRGLVRCGVCQHVFSGIDYLRYVDDAARTAQRLARERAAAGPGAPSTPGAASAPQSVAPERKAADASQAGASVASLAGAPAQSPTTRPAAPDGMSDTPSHAAREAEAFGGLVTRAGGTTGGLAPTGPVQAPLAPDVPGESPADPWAAAAHAAHERSLRDAAPDEAARGTDPLRGAGSLAPGAYEPGRAMPGSGTDPWAATASSGGFVESAPQSAPQSAPRPASESAASAPAAMASSDAAPSTTTAATAATPSAPSAPVQPAMPAAAGFPALPAPGARRRAAASLDDLLARPTVPWPTTAGPQTIISDDEDLKTAFFLPDSAFGPQTGDGAESGPRTVSGPASRIDAIDPDPITRLRPEARRAPPEEGAVELPLQPPRGFFDEATIDAPMTEIAGAPSRRDARAPERAIDYFPGVRNRSRGLGLALSPAAWIAAGALTLLLGLQAAVGWRDAIAARAPFVSPLLGALLAPFGAAIAPPRDLDALTIEGFELQPAGSPNALQLSAVLRNRSAHAVGYPAMELTLTDSGGAMLVRKVIPVDAWLPDPAARAAGIAAGTERPLRLALEHNGLQPTGYAVALFYP
ncbi:MAG: DUF3426 domain-containing protein [Burkholderiales bacterium]|jgi:predicted Zn finger-like uncharacterized protein